MTPNNTKRIFLIDGSSQMYRAYHAIRDLTGPDGRPTNAVYGFVTMLRKLITDHKPDFLAAAFDLAGPTFRSELAADYKANRAPMPLDLVEQVPLVHEVCEALGVPVLTSEKYEADDVIGTLAFQAVAQGLEVVIVTSDKDFFQLVNGQIRVFDPRKTGAWFDTDAVKEKMGVDPSQVVDLLSLMGDAVDNVKGVPGIGKKGGQDLINAYGSLENLLSHASEVTQKRYRTALLESGEAARHSKLLVQIRTNVPVTFKADALRYQGPDSNQCFKLFSRFGFRTLVADHAPTVSAIAKNYAIVRSATELDLLINDICSSGQCGVSVITEPQETRGPSLIGITLSSESGQARYVPVGHRAMADVTDLDTKTAMLKLAPMFADESIRKIGHDLKTDCLILERHGFKLSGLDVDTMLLSYVLDATRSTHKLGDLSLDQLGYRNIGAEELLGRGTKALSFGDLPPEAVLNYAGERSDAPIQLAEQMAPQLKRDGLDSVYTNLERPLIAVLVAIEQAGVCVNTEILQTMSVEVGRKLDGLQHTIQELAGLEFNINSPKQLSDVLFNRLKLPTLKRTGKTKVASTSVQVLEELAVVHELPRKVLEWRSLQKLKGTYIDALPKLVNPDTGRIHTSFNQAVTVTGRLSSSDPNLQNIPIRSELGREIRRAFVADPGMVLISADYSQIELRVLAHLANDETLIDAFRRGEDIHQQTANKVFGSKSNLDAHELRRRAKIINYALLYGKTAFTLARDIGVSQKSAQEFIDAYFEGFPAVREYITAIVDQARETKVATTMFGRRRPMPELVSSNGQVRAAAERAAVNMPIQGTAADILKRAMIDIHEGLPSGVKMILTVHDELVFEAPEAKSQSVAKFVRERMEGAASLDVPLTVDLGIGINWKDAKG
jgi:DNA polymerase-1